MPLKGFDKFHEKLPILAGKRIIAIPIYVLTILFLLISIIIQVYDLPISGNVESDWYPILAVIIIECIGLIMVYQMWLWRDYLKAKYQQSSYQRIFLIGFGGILIIITMAFNGFNAAPKMSNPILHTSIPLLFGWNFDIIEILQKSLGILFLVLGLGTMLRSIVTFGFDYMTVVYLYFPEESQIQNHEIYSVLRHPTYAGLIYICFGGLIFNFTLFHVFYFLIYVVVFGIHILFVEEKELIKRFGESYDKYRKSIPAILVRPNAWGIYLRFLLGLKKKSD